MVGDEPASPDPPRQPGAALKPGIHRDINFNTPTMTNTTHPCETSGGDSAESNDNIMAIRWYAFSVMSSIEERFGDLLNIPPGRSSPVRDLEERYLAVAPPEDRAAVLAAIEGSRNGFADMRANLVEIGQDETQRIIQLADVVAQLQAATTETERTLFPLIPRLKAIATAAATAAGLSIETGPGGLFRIRGVIPEGVDPAEVATAHRRLLAITYAIDSLLVVCTKAELGAGPRPLVAIAYALLVLLNNAITGACRDEAEPQP